MVAGNFATKWILCGSCILAQLCENHFCQHRYLKVTTLTVSIMPFLCVMSLLNFMQSETIFAASLT
jgi:uncharacterized membrane protein YfbV (UPF0208 family)